MSNTDQRLAPIVCTLDEVAYRDRAAAWAALSRRARISAVRTAGGVELTYRREVQVERALRELVELERVCCPFLEFELTTDAEEVRLRVLAPVEAMPVLEEFLLAPPEAGIAPA